MSHNEPRVSDAEVEGCAHEDIVGDPAVGRGSIISNLARDLRDCRAELTAAREALRAAERFAEEWDKFAAHTGAYAGSINDAALRLGFDDYVTWIGMARHELRLARAALGADEGQS